MSCCVLSWTERGREERTGLGTKLNVDLHLCRYSEKSKTKCIGITIETRPDYCLKKHLRFGSLFLPPSPPFCLPPLSPSFSLPPSPPALLSSISPLLSSDPPTSSPSSHVNIFLLPLSPSFYLLSLSPSFFLLSLSPSFFLLPPIFQSDALLWLH